MKHSRLLLVLFTFAVPLLSIAQNEQIWRAFDNANLPLAMELIEKHRDALNPLYHPNGEERTILWFLQEYDLIRSNRQITEAQNDDFVEVITHDRPKDWIVNVDEVAAEQGKQIKRFCGPRGLVGHTEDKYLVHATENQIFSLVENCFWVQSVHGL